MKIKFVDRFSDFGKGFIAGVIVSAIVFGFIAGFIYLRNKDRELIEYAQRQIEIEKLREDYINRDPNEFIDDIPGVRGAVDGATIEFERRRDEILERFRSRIVN